MRLIIRSTLTSDPRIQVEGEAATAEEAITLARSVEPGLIILDHQLDGELMGLDAAGPLKQAAPRAKILLFTAFDLEEEAVANPAVDAFLRKSDFNRLLPTALTLLGLPQRT